MFAHSTFRFFLCQDPAAVIQNGLDVILQDAELGMLHGAQYDSSSEF